VIAVNGGDDEAHLSVSLPAAEGRVLEPVELSGWPSPGPRTLGPGGTTEIVLAPRTGCYLRLG
jgi:hypothetical protein